MSITYTLRRRDSRSFTGAGSGVTFTVATGTRGPNLISDATALGDLTDAVADALALLASNAAGTAARKVAITSVVRAILQATTAAQARAAIGLTDPNPSPAGSFTLASITVDSTGRVTAASSGAAGGIAIGDTVTNGTAGRVLYVGAGGLLAETEAIRVHVASGFLIIPAIYDRFASRNIYLTGDYVVTERAVRVEGWVAHPEFPVLEARSAVGQTGPLLRLSDSGGTTLSAILAGGGWQPASMTDAAAPNNTVYYSTTASKLVYKDGGGVVNTLY